MILIDQLKQIYIDGELEIIDTAVYFNRVFKKNYIVALNCTGSALDDPDQHFFENYACGSLRNYNGYCNPEMTALFEAQSRERDTEKRRSIVWDIERKLVEDVARPIISHSRRRRLLAAPGQGPDDHGQQHLQRLALRGHLARPLTCGPLRLRRTPASGEALLPVAGSAWVAKPHANASTFLC